MRRCGSAWCGGIPVTGRKSLFLSSHAGAIIGWPVPEARAFLRDLTERATERRFVYAHKWQPFDLVMWDNRQLMHRVRRFDETQVRDMRRTTVAGDARPCRRRRPDTFCGTAAAVGARHRAGWPHTGREDAAQRPHD